jgi:hypothetical protein
MSVNLPPIVQKILKQITSYVRKRRCTVSDLFRAVDETGDGDIDLEELRIGLDRIGIRVTDANFVLLAEAFDPDGSGSIDFEEFETALQVAAPLNNIETKDEKNLNQVNDSNNSTDDYNKNKKMIKNTSKNNPKERGKGTAVTAVAIITDMSTKTKENRNISAGATEVTSDTTDIETKKTCQQTPEETIRQLEIALQNSESKWQKKFENLKMVLQENHKTTLKKTIAKYKDDIIEEKSKWNGIQLSQNENSEKREDREKTALRAKCAHLSKELKTYKKIVEDYQQEKEEKLSEQGKKTQARNRWTMIRTDMKKTADAKDKLAEVMRQGTIKALRSVREDALKALAETRRKLEETNAEAGEKEIALNTASNLQAQMKEQIEFLHSVVERTDQEKKKFEERNAEATRERIKHRFAAAKSAASHRRTENALLEANQEINELKKQALKLKARTNEDEDLNMKLALMSDKLESSITLSKCLRGWIRFQGLTYAILFRNLMDKLKSASMQSDSQQEKLQEQKKQNQTLQQTLKNSVLRESGIQVELTELHGKLKQMQEDRHVSQSMILYLTLHTNTLMQFISSGGTTSLQQKIQTKNIERNITLSTKNHQHPIPPPVSNRNSKLKSSRGKAVRGMGSRHRRIQEVRRSVLCLVDVPDDSAILTGWALSNNYKTISVRTTENNGFSINKQDMQNMQNMHAIVWYPPSSAVNVNRSSSLPELSQVTSELESNCGKIRAKQFYQKMQEWMQMQQNGEDDRTQEKKSSFPYFIIISDDENEWIEFASSINESCKIVVVSPPVTSKKLSNVLL